MLHDLYRSWRRLADTYPGERMFVGEILLENQVELARFVRPDELQLTFNFTFLFESWSAAALRATIERTLDAFGAVEATPTWVLENHDVTRLPTRYGGGEQGVRRARAAALLLLALPGTAFVYQGQELGLEEVDLPDELRQDPIFFRTNGERAGRDGCRVPIPWENGRPGFGFTTGTPWLPIPDEWEARTVSAQAGDPSSILELYRSALRLRPREAPFAWLESPPGSLTFARGNLTCLVNVDAEPVALPEGEPLLSSDPDVGASLPSDSAAWVRTKGSR